MNVEDILRKPPTEQPGRTFRVPWDEALMALEDECAADERNAQALCDAANLRVTLWCFGFVPRDEALPKARREVKQAFAIQSDFAPAHTMQGVLDLADWKWGSAEDHFRRAIDLNPSSAWALHWYALFLGAMGRHEEAIRYSLRSVELDNSPGLLVGHGSIHYFAQQFEKLAAIMERTIAASPDFASAYDWLGMAYVQLGRFDESIAVYRRATELSDGIAEILGGLGHAYGIAGRVGEARDVLNYLENCAQHNYVPPVQIAFVAFSIGETERGFALLEQAFREKSWELAFSRAEPWLLHLHGDPRFQDLQRRINFPS